MKTKIIATIGPSSKHPAVLNQLINSGVDIARINTKYGSINQYKEITNTINSSKRCKILFDIKGQDMIPWLQTQNFDYLAVSFAETAKQIKQTRAQFQKGIKIIAKIETRKGIKNINHLINSSDGIMVARGDLGRNIRIESVPIAQKLIIKKCNKKEKMVITATEMLLSMTKSTIPERAEVSDIANAIIDGSNALMLSEETSIGKYPVQAVKIMKKVIIETEKNKRFLK